MACEDTIGMLTVTVRVLKKGRLFQPNEQYCYKEKLEKLKGCGCGGRAKKLVNFYVVEVDGVDYELNENTVTESTVPIPLSDQDSKRPFNIGDDMVSSYQALLAYKPCPAAIRRQANIVYM
jgi:hypothetical protein